MKKLIPILLSLIVLSSCNTTKEILVVDKTIFDGKIVLPAFHDHICDSTGCTCFYLEETYIEYTDTIVFEYYITVDKKKAKKIN